MSSYVVIYMYIEQEYEKILHSLAKRQRRRKERERERKKVYNRLNGENVTYNRVYDACINVVVNIDFQNFFTRSIYSSYRLSDFYTVK